MGSDTVTCTMYCFCCTLHMSVWSVLFCGQDGCVHENCFIRPRVRAIMYASTLMRAVIVLHAMICARSSEYRHERGVQARSGKNCVISAPRAGPVGHEGGPPAGSGMFANRRIHGPDPPARSAGPTRGSAENNSRVMVCLLYTSPSPRDQRGSRMPSSA